MLTKTMLLASSVAASWPLSQGGTKVLEPIANKSGAPEFLIFLPEVGTTADQYLPQMRAIQEKASFPLTVGIGNDIEAVQRHLNITGSQGFFAGGLG